MKKENIVKESRDFSNTMNNGKKYWNEVLTIYILENNLDKYRFGISVSKKIGNAVVRNKIKRQLRSIIDKYKNIYPKNKDYIIIVRRNYIKFQFSEINSMYINLMKKILHTKEIENENETQ